MPACLAAAMTSARTCDTKPRVGTRCSAGSDLSAAIASSGRSVTLSRSKTTSEGCFSRTRGSTIAAVRSKYVSTRNAFAAVEIFTEKRRSSTTQSTMALLFPSSGVPEVILETRAVPPFMKNVIVVGCERTRDAILIDPGDEADQLLAASIARGLRVQHILLTHAHLDHVTGVAAAKAALGVPVYLHRDDLFLYERVVEQGAMFGFPV